ncbi:hypothetical protein [Cohnella fermenti]|uniref:Uncharacterized protein n=1 Tax=Cohnella fermenti TaxID=2565925 RepID=A0A4S4BHC9_9BACL|nr:hypothetical protein [Cohnella fermenti]THF73688.1 hypothetical protein E6C55_28300 [Cohnella fermenti]
MNVKFHIRGSASSGGKRQRNGGISEISGFGGGDWLAGLVGLMCAWRVQYVGLFEELDLFDELAGLGGLA